MGPTLSSIIDRHSVIRLSYKLSCDKVEVKLKLKLRQKQTIFMNSFSYKGPKITQLPKILHPRKMEDCQ